jgi:hypothetical protein
MAAMQTVSARIPVEDLEWLAMLEIQGATTPSDKLRAMLSQVRRQHEGSMDYSASLQWMRDLVVPFATAIGELEHRQGQHSEVLRLISDWAPQVMAALVAESRLGREPQRRAQERLLARCLQLTMGIVRLAITPTADCYDPELLERSLPQLIELVQVIATRRKALANGV